jgi:hypothetical protein
VHPAYLLLSTSLDHVNPVGRGGSSGDRDNLVAACWPFNSGKADLTLDELGRERLPEVAVHSDWDGHTGSFPEPWEAAGQPDRQYHARWLRALAVGDAAATSRHGRDRVPFSAPSAEGPVGR